MTLLHSAPARGRDSRIEARVVYHHDGGLGAPRRKERAPRMFGPSGTTQVEMPVARPQTEPVHRRKMAYGVTRVRVHHQLGFCGRTRGEVEEQRIGREGGTKRVDASGARTGGGRATGCT